MHTGRNTLILILVFVGTLLLRYNQYYVFREFNSDKARQLHGAYNLLHKKGLTIESYNLTTFKPNYRYVNDWPPAYSIITAGISFITTVDLYKASVVLDLLSITVIWIALLWITRLLKFTLLQQSLLFVFLSLSKTVLTQFLSADLLGVGIFLITCALCIRHVQNVKSKQQQLFFYSLQFILFFLLIFLKFSLIPAAIAPSISIIFYGVASKRREVMKSGFILLSLVFAAIIMLFIYNKQVSGDSVTYTRVMTENVLHFENLLMFNPFIGSAFFYFSPLYNRFQMSTINGLALLITIISLVVFFLYFIKNLKENKLRFFDFLLLVVMIIVSGFLMLVSLRFPKDDQGGFQWTFVNEYRYFAPAVVLFLLFAYRFFVLRNFKNFYSLFFSILVGLSFVTTIGLEIYYLLIKNQSTSFQNLYGTVFRVADYVQKQSDADTYFIALSNYQPTDTEVTSLVALKGGKVAVSYSNYFDPASTNVVFDSKQLIAPGKKVIIYYGPNKTVLENINRNNKYWIEKNEKGDEFLIIKN